MSAYMWCNIWHLYPVDIVVSADHMIKSVLPVHCHKGHSIIIIEKEPTVAINGFFHFWSIPVLDNCLKHFCYILLLLAVPLFRHQSLWLIYRISDVLCNWWSIFTVLFSRSMFFSVSPQNSDIRVPV